MQLIIACLIAGFVGFVGYFIAAKCDKRSRDLDLYQKQLEAAAEKIGELHVFADIMNEIQHPSEVVVTSDKILPFHSTFTSKNCRYIIMPIAAFTHMPALWKARMGSLMQQAKEVLGDIEWPHYQVTLRDPNPPHHFTSKDILA